MTSLPPSLNFSEEIDQNKFARVFELKVFSYPFQNSGYAPDIQILKSTLIVN